MVSSALYLLKIRRSSHPGATFMTCAARKVSQVGSLRRVQELAGHTSLAMTQRSIEGDTGPSARSCAALKSWCRGVCELPAALRRVHGWWSGALSLPYTPVGSLGMWWMGSPIVLVITLMLGSV